MGLFDKFRKKVQIAASEADTESLTAEEGSDEAIEAISQHQEIPNLSNPKPASEANEDISDTEDEWEDFDEDEDLQLPSTNDDEWEDFDEDEDYSLPTKLTRKEKKILAKNNKRDKAKKKLDAKQRKKRGGKEVERLAGSKVDLHMMRTTTGRQLVEVKSSPTGGIGSTDEEGITIDLGGGVV